MKQKTTKPRTLAIALISTFAVLNIFADLFPITPILGTSGAFFKLGWIFAPLTGILLGPVAGGISCILASVIEFSFGIQSWIFGILSPFRAGLAAFQAGLLQRGKWKTASIILLILIFSWLSLPSGRNALIVLSFPILGFFLILFFGSRIEDYIASSVWKKTAFGFVVASYCGNISRHLLGNTLLVLLTNMSPIIFVSAIPLTLIEQTLFAIASSILGMALMRTRLKAITRSLKL
jgi:hypothetical protein